MDMVSGDERTYIHRGLGSGPFALPKKDTSVKPPRPSKASFLFRLKWNITIFLASQLLEFCVACYIEHVFADFCNAGSNEYVYTEHYLDGLRYDCCQNTVALSCTVKNCPHKLFFFVCVWFFRPLFCIPILCFRSSKMLVNFWKQVSECKMLKHHQIRQHDGSVVKTDAPWHEGSGFHPWSEAGVFQWGVCIFFSCLCGFLQIFWFSCTDQKHAQKVAFRLRPLLQKRTVSSMGFSWLKKGRYVFVQMTKMMMLHF